MDSPIEDLTSETRKQLFEDLYYLNTKELCIFCDRQEIPYRILLETENGDLKPSRDKDRKKVVIKRIIHFLKTGEIPAATVFPKEIVRHSGLPDAFDKKDRLFYGCYDKKNPEMIRLLRELTGGEFKNGAIARILLRDFWSRGEAPTFDEYAKAWIAAKNEYSLEQHPEAAYLTDRAKGTAGSNWKEIRIQKAKGVQRVLSEIESSQK